jgi:hypothetical protein
MRLLLKHFGMLLVLAVNLVLLLFFPISVKAHCDTMDGPVVKAAQKALETGNVDLVLIWVQPKDEGLIKDAFNKTIAVRKLGVEAVKFADMYFFETLVRIHRAGEGAPYTGIEPAGTVIDPGIAIADKAVESGYADDLIKHLTETVQNGVIEHFNELKSKRNYNKDDIKAGREYVESYVVFIHYIERLFQDAEKAPEEHSVKPEETSVHQEH